MNFASWLISEEVALLQQLRPNNQIVALGRIGLWDVYSAMPYPRSFNGTKTPIMSLDRYLKSAQQRPVSPQFAAMYGNGPMADRVEDKVADNVPMVKQMLEKAAYGLSALGFRKHSTTLVFMDMGGKRNHITGGGVGGEAWGQEHGCTVDRRFATSPYGVDTTVHEHAHMYWNEVLSAADKRTFENWWDNNVKRWEPDEKGSEAFNFDAVEYKKSLKERVPHGLKMFI